MGKGRLEAFRDGVFAIILTIMVVEMKVPHDVNLTVVGGLFEKDIAVGDRFLAGTAEIMAIQPRLSCFKPGIRFGTQRMVKKFAASKRYGVYFRVMNEGDIGTGDLIMPVAKSRYDLSIHDLGRLLTKQTRNRLPMERAANNEFLPDNVREYFSSLLEHEL